MAEAPLRTVLGLAVRDMAREPAHVACIVLLIAGVLAPLLLLVAVKAGVMQTLIGTLRENPQMRLIDIVGNHGFGAAELADIAAWPETEFVVPEERSIARRLELRAAGARQATRADLVSSAPGDPLLPPGVTLSAGQIAITPTLAQRQGVAAGDRIEAYALRGQPPTARLRTELEIVHVLPRGWLPGSQALVPAAFVSEVEAFFDDFALPHYGVPDGKDIAERPGRYESFRIYARDIRDVVSLEERIEQRLNVTVRSRAADIAPLLALDRNVGRALNILMICGALGLGAALLALFWANVERKRVTLSMLALMGAPPLALALFPVVQAALYALGGVLAAALVFAAGMSAFNAMFAEALARLGGGSVTFGDPGILAAMAGGSILIAVLAAGAAAVRASGTDPAIVIRSGG
ncbi:MAG: hypothetical protein AAF409_11260 [Pseudomonadota bacterium]